MAEQFVTREMKWSHNLQHSTSALAGLNGWSEKPDLINQLVVSNPSTNMTILTVFFKLLSQQTGTQPYFILKSARKQWLRVNCAEIVILAAI